MIGVHLRKEEVQWSGNSSRYCWKPFKRISATTTSITQPFQKLPASNLMLAPPTSVNDIAITALTALKDDDYFELFTIEQIKEMAKV